MKAEGFAVIASLPLVNTESDKIVQSKATRVSAPSPMEESQNPGTNADESRARATSIVQIAEERQKQRARRRRKIAAVYSKLGKVALNEPKGEQLDRVG